MRDLTPLAMLTIVFLAIGCSPQREDRATPPETPIKSIGELDTTVGETAGPQPVREPPEPLTGPEQKFLMSVKSVFLAVKDWPPQANTTRQMVTKLRERYLKGVDDRDFEFHKAPSVWLAIEKSPSWDPMHVARSIVLAPLDSVRNTFQSLFGLASLEMDPPVQIVLLKDRQSYDQYRIGKFGSPAQIYLSHHEPGLGRLVLHADVAPSAFIHDAAHLMVRRESTYLPSDMKRVLWIHAGLARWFEATKRMVDTETGGWKYEHGLIDTEACDHLGRTERYHLTLSQLIGLSGDVGLGCIGAPPYDPPLQKATHRVVIAQGWALTYFLMSFDVDDEGLVKIGSPKTPVQGRYRDDFLRYMNFVLKGRNGKRYEGKNAFMEAFNLDNDSLQIMEKDFAAYQKFLVRKKSMRHIRKKQLLRWSDTSHGKSAGRREDDLLRQ